MKSQPEKSPLKMQGKRENVGREKTRLFGDSVKEELDLTTQQSLECEALAGTRG